MNKDVIYTSLISNLKSKGVATGKVEKAYEVADFLHRNQKRKSGEEYITHPLKVALILAELDFEADVISAAILHDTIEDCDYTLENMKEAFGENVAQIVDAVSAIDKEQYIFNSDDLYENEAFLKESREEQTFKKLIAIAKKNPLGLFVKFADRLNNLQTIDIFERSKQLEKVKQTERWVLPLAKTINSRFFYDEIKNECFKITNGKDKYFLEQFNFYHRVNRKNFDYIIGVLKEKLSHEIFNNILMEQVKEYQVFDEISAITKNATVNNITQGFINKVPTNKIYFIYKGSSIKNAINDFFNKQSIFQQNGIVLVGENIGRISHIPHLKFIDSNRNIYLAYFVTTKEYLENRNGTLEGQNISLMDDIDTHKIITTYIKVKTRSGEIMYIPEGSTVLDFAFKIHKDIGLGFKYANVNQSKTKIPPYTTLKDGDQVEIIVNRNKDDEIENCAELKWFAYIETDNAKKILIKNFEKQK